MRRIRAFPSIDLRLAAHERCADDPILSRPELHLYSSGRAAIYHAVSAMGFPAGSGVLMPAFNCGVEVEAVLRAGLEVDYYDPGQRLGMDLADLAGRVTTRTRALLVIHYFGVPQDVDAVARFCRERSLVLIEDCAHALYSSHAGRLLGTYGDVAIYSLYKTCGITNGGALLSNTRTARPPARGRRYNGPSLIKRTVRSALEHEEDRGTAAGRLAGAVLGAYRARHDAEAGPFAETTDDVRGYYHEPMFGYESDISFLSKPWLGKEPHDRIVARRRENHRTLVGLIRGVAGCAVLFPELADGVCPLCCVIEVDDSDRVVARMSELGVDVFVFGRHPHPTVPLEDFPAAERFSRRLVGLPVQQQLHEADMLAVADALGRALG